ncbi:MAG: protein kinase [Thermosynechococcaceae cyanobacterium]
MLCCLNPDCEQPLNPDEHKHCQHCGTLLVTLLRNRYRILKPLGRGGFGKTYLAEDIDKLNEQCVVKQLAYQGHSSASTIQKVRDLFEREARQLQALGEHPQIPQLIAYFEEQDYPYLVQQFIAGETLQAEYQSGTYGETQVRQLLTDLLPVLEFIHQQGVIHRDIKPENILRRQQDGKPVLIDFGVSKMLTVSVMKTTGTILGSQGYASLEQLQQGQANPASDLYSLGVTCFQMLSNTAPSALWLQDGFGWTNNWQQYVATPLSGDLVMLLNRLLHQEAEQRYQSASAVLEDLKSSSPETVRPSASSGSSVQTLPIPDAIPRQQTFKRRPIALIAVGIIGVGLFGATLAWAISQQLRVITPNSSTRTAEAPTSDTPSIRTSPQPTTAPAPSSNINQVDIGSLPAPPFSRQPPRPTPQSNSSVQLKLVTAQPNQITDDEAWYERNQIALPTYEVPNPFRQVFGNVPAGIPDRYQSNLLVRAIQAENQILLMYGPNFSGGHYLFIYDQDPGEFKAGFDFRSYLYGPVTVEGERDFVEQTLTWAMIEKNVLYVSHGHNTYAKSSGGINAYITAIDLETKNVLWHSPPLVANATNFELVGDVIVTGYGFTAEPDFLYLLNKKTGKVLQQIPLDTAASVIIRKGDQLFVRGYNRDYVFQIQDSS